MQNPNLIQQKTYAFAKQIVLTYINLRKEKKEFALSTQLVKSGTSIGANVEEAIGGQTKKDFIAKMNIAFKEARETKYWIRLLSDVSLLNQKDSEQLLEEINSICNILARILITATKNK